MKKYEINKNTLAIIAITNGISKVYEKDKTLYVYSPTIKIIDDSCKFFGSSYEGRFCGTKALTGITYKSPIIIEESRNIIFFPTNSTRSKQTSWIALNKIKKIYKNKSDKSYIIFNNDKKLNLNISLYSLENQYCRAIMLKSKLLD